MAPKRSLSQSPASNLSKRPRKVMNLEDKMEIIKRYDRGQRTADIVRATGVSESTLRTIRASKDKIVASLTQGSSASAKKTHTVRMPGLNKTEGVLKDWIDHQSRRNLPISMGIIQTKARQLFNEVTKDIEDAKPFSASTGWFSKFKIRHGFTNVKFSGEAASADKPAADAFIKTLEDYIEDNGYRPEQIFNLDETCLYPYRTFDRTYISEEEKRKPGFKPSKTRFTVMVGTNLVGHKLMPMVIGKSEKPHCFKGIIKENLPVHYYHSLKGWMTSYVWGHYTTFTLENELKKYCREKNIDFKILLLCDNYSGHGDNFLIASEHITIKFLPPNTTPLIQPMDQGVIRMFKVNYTRISLQRMVQKIDNNPNTEDRDVVRKYMSNFNLLHAIYIIHEAWECVSLSCIKGAWRKLCPYLLGDFGGFCLVEEETRLKKDLLNNARQVGFNEVDEEEIDKLLSSHEKDLTTEDLLEMQNEREEESQKEMTNGDNEDNEEIKQITSKHLTEIFTKLDEIWEILQDNDTNQQRVCKLQQNVRQAFHYYYSLQHSYRINAKQKTMDSFFKKHDKSPQPSNPTSEEPLPSTSGEEPLPSIWEEPQPSTSKIKSPPKRQMTLIESLTLKTAFHGFDEEDDPDDLPCLDISDQE